eukprot:3941150-Rhodomonas_salina.3
MVLPHVDPGTDVACGLRACYAMSDTDMAFGPIRCGPCRQRPLHRELRSAPLSAYAPATPCPVLSYRTALSPYGRATRSPVLTTRMALPGMFTRTPSGSQWKVDGAQVRCYGMSGTGLRVGCNAATACPVLAYA